MSLRINHNIAAVNGHRNMVKNDAMVSKSLERLSSGLRVNKAADDAAGLVISEQMRAQLSGLNQAVANSEQAVTLVQTAEGALDETNSLLNKARSLALHAANEGLNDQNAVIADQGELDNIIDSVTRISSTTQFGTKKLLDGSLGSASSKLSGLQSVKLGGDYASKLAGGTVVKGFNTLQVTAQATQASAVVTMAGAADIFSGGTLAAATGTDVVQRAFSISINGSQLTIASGSTKNQLVQQINAVGAKVGFTATLTGSATGGTLGDIVLQSKDYGSQTTFNVQFVSGATGASTVTAAQTAGVDMAATLYLYSGGNGVGGTATTGSTQTLALAASGNGLRLVDGKGAVLTFNAAVGIVTGAAGSGGVYYGAVDSTKGGATFQIGANVQQTATVALGSSSANDIGTAASGTYSSLAQLKGSSLVSGNAQEALKVIDKAIDDITTARGALGAFQANTLETSINSLRVTQENLTAAESTIRDVDFAAESSQFTKNNILVQASTAMLAQANQLPQNVLKLLG
jgi:flagellin